MINAQDLHSNRPVIRNIDHTIMMSQTLVICHSLTLKWKFINLPVFKPLLGSLPVEDVP
jgi:hypothetical protein